MAHAKLRVRIEMLIQYSRIRFALKRLGVNISAGGPGERWSGPGLDCVSTRQWQSDLHVATFSPATLDLHRRLE
jgi:hypothetical protein